MKTFASAALVGFAAASGLFDTLHSLVDETEQLVDEAQPLLDEIVSDYQELSDVVQQKANVYMSLFEELRANEKEEEVVVDEPSLRGNFLTSSIEKNNHGCIVEQTVYDNEYVETVVTAPSLPYHYDYAQ